MRAKKAIKKDCRNKGAIWLTGGRLYCSPACAFRASHKFMPYLHGPADARCGDKL